MFGKDRLCQLLFKVCCVNLVRASMCTIMSEPIEGIETSQMIIPVKNRMCLSYDWKP